jgi:hypothetical protein
MKNTEEKYYIYHLEGKKIGCTNSIKRRNYTQPGEYIILEEHTDIYLASDREIELQKEYGYRIDNIPYWQFMEINKKSHTPEVRLRAVANTDYEARSKNTDYDSIVAKIDWKSSRLKSSANTDYKAKAKKCQKAVICKLEDGTLYGEWESIIKASQITSIDTANIGKCLAGKIKYAGKSPQGDKLYWSYALPR